MAQAKTVSEERIRLWSICPLRDEATDPLLVTAFRIARLAVLRSFEGRPLDHAAVCDRFVKSWREQLGLSKDQAPPTSGPYWEGPRASARVAARLLQLLTRWEVLQPIQPYALELNGYTIKGEYSLLKRRGRGSFPMVLRLRTKSFPYRASPDLVSLARYVHVKMTHWEWKQVGILHLPLLRGPIWHQRHIQERLATNWLKSILESVAEPRLYPVPGNYCTSCLSKHCQEVFDQND